MPIIGAVYVVETGSVIINRMSRKLRHGKKVFLSSPIHHHFEAIGWPETKVTMRFWILGQVAGVLGLIIFLMGRQVKVCGRKPPAGAARPLQLNTGA